MKKTIMSDKVTQIDRKRDFIDRRNYAQDCELHMRRASDRIPLAPLPHWGISLFVCMGFVSLVVTAMTMLYTYGDSLTNAQWLMAFIGCLVPVMVAMWAGELAYYLWKSER